MPSPVAVQTMVRIESASRSELDVARRLHNRFTDQSVSHETMHARYEAVPGLFLLAREDGEAVGVATGARRSETVAGLAGLGVVPERRGEGIGGRLLERFEAAAAEAGFSTVGVASAGGYVDRFYADHGYTAHRILVRRPADAELCDPATLGYEVHESRVEGATRKDYLAAEGVDQEVLDAVRADLDEEAVYILRKSLETA